MAEGSRKFYLEVWSRESQISIAHEMKETFLLIREYLSCAVVVLNFSKSSSPFSLNLVSIDKKHSKGKLCSRRKSKIGTKFNFADSFHPFYCTSPSSRNPVRFDYVIPSPLLVPSPGRDWKANMIAWRRSHSCTDHEIEWKKNNFYLFLEKEKSFSRFPFYFCINMN